MPPRFSPGLRSLAGFILEDGGKPPLSQEDLLEAIGEAMAQYVEEQLTPLAKRITELEARPHAYSGVWEHARKYSPGAMVTHAGGLWVAKIECTGLRPGGDKISWQLAVKRGKAA